MVKVRTGVSVYQNRKGGMALVDRQIQRSTVTALSITGRQWIESGEEVVNTWGEQERRK
jgi:hypothetical protein